MCVFIVYRYVHGFIARVYKYVIVCGVCDCVCVCPRSHATLAVLQYLCNLEFGDRTKSDGGGEYLSSCQSAQTRRLLAFDCSCVQRYLSHAVCTFPESCDR